MDKRADVNATNKSDKTPADLAHRAGNHKMLETIQKRGGQRSRASKVANAGCAVVTTTTTTTATTGHRYPTITITVATLALTKTTMS